MSINITGSAVEEFLLPIMARLRATNTQWLRPEGDFDGELPLLVGEAEITSMMAPPKVVWLPLYDTGYEVADEQPDDGEVIYMTWTVLEVRCWGRTLAEAERLRTSVLDAVYETGENHAKPLPGKGTYSAKGQPGEKGVTLRFLVGFKQLLLLHAFQQATVTEVEAITPDVPPDDSPDAPQPIEGLFVDHVIGEDRDPLPP